MQSIKNSFRKVGEYAREHPVITSLLAGGSVLGTAGVLQKLSQDDQEAMLETAIAAENEGSGEALGLSSGGLLGAAVVLGMLEDDGDDIIKRVVTTTPGSEREYSTVMGTAQYRDPMD